MASDPTQTQAQTRRPDSPAAREWYVVTGGGSALRMTPGLTVGESESGALTLNDPQLANQWIEFVLADNGEPWATITIRDKSLRVAGSTCLRHPLQVGTTVRLPNNTLHISRDIRMPPLSGIVVEVVHREVPGRPQLVVGPELEQALTTGPETRPDMPAAEIPEPFDPMEASPGTAEADPAPDADAPDYWSDDTLTVAEPQRPRSAGRRRQVAVMAGALAVGAVTLAGVLAMLVSMSGRETARVADLDRVPVETPAASSEAPRPAGSSGDVPPLQTEPVPPADVADEGSGGQASPVTLSPSESSDAGPPDTLAAGEPAETIGEPAGAPARPPSATPETADSGSSRAADATAPSEPDAATAEEPEQVAMLPRAEQEPLAPIATPSIERRSLPPAPPSGSAAAADPQTRDGQPGTPDPTVAAEPEQIPESPREPAPQSVRDGLINSAMAQLAGGALDDARRSLQAAADAGVNPELIADLRGEVDYRQRLIDAEAGRFDTLYPIDQLVAVSQEPPSVPRYASIGAEVSVEAQFTVTASGNVDDVIVLDDPPESLAQAVRRAVSEWRFEPVLYNGRPLPVRSSVRFTFQN